MLIDARKAGALRRPEPKFSPLLCRRPLLGRSSFLLLVRFDDEPSVVILIVVIVDLQLAERMRQVPAEYGGSRLLQLTTMLCFAFAAAARLDPRGAGVKDSVDCLAFCELVAFLAGAFLLAVLSTGVPVLREHGWHPKAKSLPTFCLWLHSFSEVRHPLLPRPLRHRTANSLIA